MTSDCLIDSMLILDNSQRDLLSVALTETRLFGLSSVLIAPGVHHPPDDDETLYCVSSFLSPVCVLF